MQETAGVESGGIPTFAEANDAELLARLRGPEPASRQAFAVVVRATHDRLLGYIRRQLGSLEESREVLQDVYLAAHKGLPRFEGKSRLTTWIYSLAYHHVCDRIAERARDRSARAMLGDGEDFLMASGDPDVSRATAWDSAPDALRARRRAEECIAEAVAALEPPGCHVYRLRDVEGLTGEEVAELLGLSHAAVRVQLHRARAEIVARARERLGAGATAPERRRA